MGRNLFNLPLQNIELFQLKSIDSPDIDEILAVHVQLEAPAERNDEEPLEPVETEEAEIFCVGLRQDGLKFAELFKDQFNVVQFMCTCCDHAFDSLTPVREHNYVERLNPVYMCHDCGACFSIAPEIKEHREKEKHCNRVIRDMEYRCLKCGQTFLNIRAVKCHEKNRHSPEKLHCLECDLFFRIRPDFHRHMKDMHLSMPSRVCRYPKCRRKFWSQEEYELHLKFHKNHQKYCSCGSLERHMRIQRHRNKQQTERERINTQKQEAVGDFIIHHLSEES
ncbi:hypothetical protein M5D96_010525 [Drosophila gunungcola]|uniref:C2H2-type domain-containing protein n=2 Tax=Drosophila gunungcola TaxID=103775 RepID=A0A9Q0BMC2_9MUSC|nr:hypothetical protein M5D96_010525 [Drosophila gunungcola]